VLPTLKVNEANPELTRVEEQVGPAEKTNELAVSDVPSTQVESQGFYAPTQAERPNLISPVGDYVPLSEIPLHLVIPVIDLVTPVVEVEPEYVRIGDVEFQQWLSPDEYAAGWHDTSARLGEVGNTVLNGHHNINGEVFRRLVELVEGDKIMVFSDEHLFTYQITNKMVLPEMDEPLDVRVKNAQWIMPSGDERLTLITCWPYYSNTHRLVIVAKRISVEALPDIDQELLPRVINEAGLLDGGN
jgi:sortase A